NQAKAAQTISPKYSALAAFFPLATNAFYTANSGLSRTLPPSFLTKEKQILALIFMKQIEK
ncbi:hypothetical protein P3719_09510, partial [Vibrio parahaemolyticus]|nr:hypothetical protein [Vibrio parahaemolyticus]MDF5583116.1 hypothetical protein [Vibrio parahaemolyticus]MDF5589735.1 hypothetical protein [Vibrio parahaemolyticus]MDG2874056.1 hypothetical protein [Vibrio parahaemolyticus]MDG2888847.1 hypothetical protein [Vibrio parahaemolyticus]